MVFALTSPGTSPTQKLTLDDYGWSAHFQAQLPVDEFEGALPVRVLTVHRDALEVAGPDYEGRLPLLEFDHDREAAATTGDWLLIDGQTHRPLKRLERRSLFKRKSAGTAHRVQLIAANVDTLFLVTSANEDFNPARLERFLALALEAAVTPVVIITKADLAQDAASYAVRARDLFPDLVVEIFDARDPGVAERLKPWFGRGRTVALLGSSGVGKSTLINTLAGRDLQETQGVRVGDRKGRHTTSGRSLHRLANGAWLMDTPGMRELQLVDATHGVDEVFDDVAALAALCRFADCKHGAEPGCAVQGALAAGTLDDARFKRYQKLLREDQGNSKSLGISRARRSGKTAKATLEQKLKEREGR